MFARNATLPDAIAIEQLIQVHVGDGTLLGRTLAEICENIRDFVVVEHEGEVVGCGALHLYGMHLAEVRSITIGSKAKGHGAGRMLIDALFAEAARDVEDGACGNVHRPRYRTAAPVHHGPVEQSQAAGQGRRDV